MHACIHMQQLIQNGYLPTLIGGAESQKHKCWAWLTVGRIIWDRHNSASIPLLWLMEVIVFKLLMLPHLLCPIPESPILCFLTSPHAFRLPTIVCATFFWPRSSFIFSQPVHHFFSSCLNPSHPSKENPSQGNFRGKDVPAAAPLCSRYCVATTPQGCFIQTQPETKSPNRLSTEGSEGASGESQFNQLSYNLSPLSMFAPVHWFITVYFRSSISFFFFLKSKSSTHSYKKKGQFLP